MDLALVYVAPRKARIEAAGSPPVTDACSVRVRTLWSGISRGTERLVFEGRVPESEYARMRAPFQQGEFPFPVEYGYAAVGIVEQGPQVLEGKEVFALAPHRTGFRLPVAAVLALPEGLPARRAVLAANMETALNAIWDAGPGPGDRIAIVGAGVLGGLLAGLCGAIPGCETHLIDTDTGRRALAAHMNVSFREPPEAPQDCDIVFHTSATEAGLATALDCAGVEATLVELSWFGDARPAVPLGEAFHSRRLRLISSQVGSVALSRRPRWSHRRRLEKALELLRDPRFDALITQEVAFESLPKALHSLLAPNAQGLATAVSYS